MFDPNTGTFGVFELILKRAEYPSPGEMNIPDYLDWLASAAKDNLAACKGMTKAQKFPLTQI